MAIQYVCDGCGKPAGDEMQEFGHVIKAIYCDICHPIVATLCGVMDALHTDLAKKWQTDRERLRNKTRKALGPNARLPDE